MIKKPCLKEGDAIEVIWLDSHVIGNDPWMTVAEAKAGYREGVSIRSVCQYFDSDKDYLYTVSDRSLENDDSESGVMRRLKIPWGAIKSIKRLFV
jgi:hypothetical protein